MLPLHHLPAEAVLHLLPVYRSQRNGIRRRSADASGVDCPMRNVCGSRVAMRLGTVERMLRARRTWTATSATGPDERSRSVPWANRLASGLPLAALPPAPAIHALKNRGTRSAPSRLPSSPPSAANARAVRSHPAMATGRPGHTSTCIRPGTRGCDSAALGQSRVGRVEVPFASLLGSHKLPTASGSSTNR